jgi:uncharacterized protein
VTGNPDGGAPVGQRARGGARPQGGDVDAPGTDDGTDDGPAAGATFDRRMLESLVCPVTQGRLRYDAGAGELISGTARLAFPIRNGIPIMLASEAREVE